MANQQHLDLLKRGTEAWNTWRWDNPTLLPDLTGADLSRVYLEGANLSEADLSGANLSGANISYANLEGTTMPDGSKFPLPS